MLTSPIPLLGSVRIHRGLTQQDLAARAGSSQGVISAIESGRTPFTVNLAQTLADALDTVPELIQQLAPEPLVLLRLQASLPAKVVNRLVADLALAHFHVRQLLGPTTADVPHGADGASPIEHARALREAWSLPPGPIDNMIRLLETHGVVCLWRDTSAIHAGAVGSWAYGEHPVIFLGRHLWPRAARVELARELARRVLHGPSSVTSTNAVDEFADEFLIPEREVVWSPTGKVDRPRLAALEETWGVPPAALLRAAYRAGAISQTHRRKLHSVVLDIGTDAAPASRERPYTILHAVRRAASSGRGFQAAAASACIDLPALQREYLADAG